MASHQLIFHLTDHLTGTNLDTDQDGNILEAIDYYPFGSVRVDDKFGIYEDNYKFTGKELDADTGLYYYGARYYDANIGRWTGEDPIFLEIAKYLKNNLEKYNVGKESKEILLNPQKLNSYSYVSNNALVHIDPWGLAEVYIREAGPQNSMSTDWKSFGGHTLIKVNDTYYGFALTKNPDSDVQKFTQKEFEENYKGQTWNVINIGDKWDKQIINKFNTLEQKGNTEEGTYRIAERNCTEVAWDTLNEVGVFDNNIFNMYKTVVPDQMLFQFKAMRVAENVYKFFNKKYNNLIKEPIRKFTNS